MNPKLKFVTEDEATKDAMTAAGITATGITPLCPFNVGDFVTFPQSPALAFRVTKRWHASGAGDMGEWYVFIEPAPHPST